MGSPQRVLLGYNPLLSLLLFNLGTRKGIKFWMERLIINLAEELGFRGN